MLYQFENGRIDYYDGLSLILIQPDTSVLRFENIENLNINKNGISFNGRYIPSRGEIVGLQYKDENNDDYQINVIYLEEDNKNIKLYCNLNIPDFDNLNTSYKYLSKKDCEFLPISEAYYKVIMTELKEKGYIYDRNNINIYKDIWEPKIDEDYWYVTSFGTVTNTYRCESDRHDDMHISIGNCFQTKAQAEEAREAFVKWFKSYRQC
jgi:hypothetical protein